MRIDIATLFPAMCDTVLHESIVGRAQAEGRIAIHTHNIRDYTLDKHRRVDDYPYGGGCGMLMQAQPIADCCAVIATAQKAELGADTPAHVVFLTAAGRPYDQQVCKRLAALPCLTLVCGHYEGIDQRVIDAIGDEELSIGDYVITGGELAAMVIADSVARLQPGVLSQPEGYEGESHYSGLLEYPQYTRPEEWQGRRVPQVLLSGHHGNIVAWQRAQSEARTKERRPDLWARYTPPREQLPAELPKAPAAEQVEKPACINRFRLQYDFLSNFYPAPVCVEGVTYLSAEAAYQAYKCPDPADRVVFVRYGASEARARARRLPVRQDWETVRLPLMRDILYAKFTQNPQLARYLADTGDLPLIETNTWGDTFWGVDLKTGEGENHLGQLLEELRTRFAAEGLPQAAVPVPVRECTAPDGLAAQLLDITQLDCEAVVHAATPGLDASSWDEPDIFRAAGPWLVDACRALGPCSVGQVCATPGFDLRAGHILHAVGPCYKVQDDAALLEATWRNVLDTALALGLHSIAAPAISTGRASFPKQLAARIAVETIRAWQVQHPSTQLRVVLASMDLGIYEAFCCALQG